MSQTNDEKLYRYVKVVFNPYSSYGYSYIDENRIAGKYDFVVVPVGDSNEEKFGMVIAVDDFTEKDAPYPVKMTKRIIRLSSCQEAENIDGNW